MKKTNLNEMRKRRKRRIRSKTRGTADRPRVVIFRSLRGIYAQVINDEKGETLAQANSKEVKGKNDIAKAKKVGEILAQKCAKAKIQAVVFDRCGYKYHGKVKALADGAREGGLNF